VASVGSGSVAAEDEADWVDEADRVAGEVSLLADGGVALSDDPHPVNARTRENAGKAAA
jgi:hypothetical protein